MIVLVDHGASNIASVLNAFRKMQVPVVVSAESAVIEKATKLVLPGVGAFDEGMSGLRRHGLDECLSTCVLSRRVPILGICLGLQLFTDGSDEGAESGLGWIPGRTVAFETTERELLRVPHMGWNAICGIADRTPLLNGINDGDEFYFAHAYHLAAPVDAAVLAYTEYGGRSFPAVVQRENIWGVQFHPEKSRAAGLRLLKNFAQLCS